MKSFKVTAAQDGKHVVKASSEAFPGLRQADLFHALKRKDIKIDGKRTAQDVAVKEGQTVEVWLPDELFEGLRVVHPRFGEGVILKVEPVGGDALITVAFDGNRPAGASTSI